ncbi:MAG: CynX/NimT family MFS transporter [Solirubrobacteraceae bacterium]
MLQTSATGERAAQAGESGPRGSAGSSSGAELTAESSAGSSSRAGLAAAGALIVVALNLRLAIAAISPLLGQVQRGTGLSYAGGGLLTAVPLFCFGAVAPIAPRLIRRHRMGPLLGLTMLVVAAGCAIRLEASLPALFVGTAVIGAGIAVGNVLLPGLIKRDFAGRATTMIALYSASLSIGAAVSAGLTLPIERASGIGWRPALAVWGLGAVLALALWMPHATRSEGSERPHSGAGLARALRRDRLAWSVTLFMGLQSFGYYATLNWLPTILEYHHMPDTRAAWMLSFSMFPGMLAALLTPAIERRMRRSGALVVAIALSCGAAYCGLLLAPTSATYVWMTLLGLGQGISISLALGYIVARAPDGEHAAHLSTMAQSGGYLLASSGPFLLGALHEITGGWTLPLLVLLVALVPLLLAGLHASRDGHVLAVRNRTAPPAALVGD